MMFKKALLTFAVAAWTLAGGSIHADDTDLYLDTTPSGQSPPLVMFSIDYRPNNLSSTVCQDLAVCEDLLIQPGYMPVQDEYTFFDLIRGAMNAVLDQVGGIRIGLMLNHAQGTGNSCTGPQPPGTQCTNGGYIAMGFRGIPGPQDDGFVSCTPFKGSGANLTLAQALESDTFAACDDGRAYFLRKMWNLPLNAVDGTGSISHSYQGKELFLELYRYLRGGPILNGHNGWESYDRSNPFYSETDGSPVDYLNEYGEPLPPGPAHPNDWNLDEDPRHADYEFATGINVLDGTEEYILDSDGFGQVVEGPDARIAWDDTPAPESNAVEDAAGINYISPLVEEDVCTKLYSVNLMFQVSNQEDDSDQVLVDDGIIPPRKKGRGAATSTFPDVISYMNDNDLAPGVAGDQLMTSYFLGADPFYKNLTMEKYASAGGTPAPLPLSESPEELIAILTRVLNEILSVSTTFVAASIPVNSFNRAEVLDQVVLALFQPNPNPADPYWFGNVKKLRLEGLGGTGIPRLVDVTGQPAIATDGRIANTALTFWTNDAYPDVLEADPDASEISGLDGRSVTRGGAGHKTPGFPDDTVGSPKSTNGVGRQVIYDGVISGKSLMLPLNANSETAADTAADFSRARVAAGQPQLTEAQTLKVIQAARGLDVYDDRPNDPDPVYDEAQPWIFGSALHSRPLLINYGARDGHDLQNPLIYVAVGTNDGMFRFIRNTLPDVSAGQKGIGHGREAWAFMPRATMNATEQTVRNEADMLPGASWNNAPNPPYGVDGSPVSYILDENGNGTVDGNDKAYVFFGLRRGGRNYYGLDVTNPENPELMWVIEGGQSPYENLGMTFSTPSVADVYDKSGNKVPGLVFGGGFDPAYDKWGTPAVANYGNSVYVVNALTGELIHEFDQDSHPDFLDPVPSPVAAVDLALSDGVFDRAYVGDLGGNVWRFNIPGNPERAKDDANWSMRLIASVGRRSTDGSDRRFFHRPDVVKSEDSAGPYDAIVIGTGNRAEPKDGVPTGADNYTYMFKDRDVSEVEPIPEVILPIQHDSTGLQDITACTIGGTPACTAPDLSLGWKLGLTASREKSLSTPLTIGGVVFFTTFIPPGTVAETGVCTPPEGSGRLYRVSLQTGNPLVNLDLPIDEQDPGSPDQRFDLLDSAGIPAEVVAIPPNRILRPDLRVEPVPLSTRWRTFWHLMESPGN
jgi:type IV pilus assembly protein PilY1